MSDSESFQCLFECLHEGGLYRFLNNRPLRMTISMLCFTHLDCTTCHNRLVPKKGRAADPRELEYAQTRKQRYPNSSPQAPDQMVCAKLDSHRP